MKEQVIKEKIDWVYSQLEDEESRFIFDKRRQFNESRDYSHIHDIIDSYVQELKEYKWYPGKEQELICEIKHRKKSVVIFGAGLNGRRVLGICKNQVEVEFFCDNDLDKQGMKIDGIEIVSLKKLLDSRGKDNYVVIVSPKYACEQIVVMLLNEGIKEENIYRYIEYAPMTLDRMQYFDEELICFGNDEVFVDGGAYDLGTTELFMKQCKPFRKIFAFEPDDTCYLKCKNKVEKMGGGGEYKSCVCRTMEQKWICEIYAIRKWLITYYSFRKTELKNN